jgi:hypothetical protein
MKPFRPLKRLDVARKEGAIPQVGHRDTGVELDGEVNERKSLAPVGGHFDIGKGTQLAVIDLEGSYAAGDAKPFLHNVLLDVLDPPAPGADDEHPEDKYAHRAQGDSGPIPFHGALPLPECCKE